MIDKSLVKKRFEKSFKTYNDNAVIQKKMAEKLIRMLPRINFNSILEIGCATGILTELIQKELKFKSYTANDLVENSQGYIKKIIPDNIFIPGDIEKIELNGNYDLIISNAALQWCENIENTIKKLTLKLNNNGILAISVFGSNNLKEIKSLLDLPDNMEVNLKGIEETQILYFNSPIDVLKHIKLTGANALIDFKFTKTKLKNFEEQYNKMYSCEKGVRLTYNPLYFVSELSPSKVN